MRVGLVGCTKSKLSYRAPAEALYSPSAMFRERRTFAARSCDRWACGLADSLRRAGAEVEIRQADLVPGGVLHDDTFAAPKRRVRLEDTRDDRHRASPYSFVSGARFKKGCTLGVRIAR